MRNAVGLTRLGERVTLTIRRGAEEKTVVADVLMPRAATAPQAPPSPRPAPVAALDGVTVTDLPPDHPLSGEVAGVFIADVAPESFAWLQGLRPNDIVTAVNQEPTGSVAEFTAAVEQSQLPLALHVRRGTRQQFILIE
jgi:serine protease Do/serine protease DegQ